jgi:hypothetical protein
VAAAECKTVLFPSKRLWTLEEQKWTQNMVSAFCCFVSFVENKKVFGNTP